MSSSKSASDAAVLPPAGVGQALAGAGALMIDVCEAPDHLRLDAEHDQGIEAAVL